MNDYEVTVAQKDYNPLVGIMSSDTPEELFAQIMKQGFTHRRADIITFVPPRHIRRVTVKKVDEVPWQQNA